MREIFGAYSHVAALLLLLTSLASGHGHKKHRSKCGLVYPRPRNAIDNTTECKEPKDGCEMGMACHWYSAGCSIGCRKCDPKSLRSQIDICGGGMTATINDPKLRTVNRMAGPGSDMDIYKHNPWRAPGTAPVADACGVAGGSWKSLESSGGRSGGKYVSNTWVAEGDKGSETLPYMETGIYWIRGSTYKVTWQVGFENPGGGYQYRLCPLSEPLTEECFQKMPLDFLQNGQELQYMNGTRQPIRGTFISEGTWPPGSMWAMNPIPPRCLSDACKAGSTCAPCPGEPGTNCTSCDDTPDPSFEPPCDENKEKCSGHQSGDDQVVAVLDHVMVPLKIPPGDYVLGFRWDAEATAQVLSNCADVQIRNPSHKSKDK